MNNEEIANAIEEAFYEGWCSYQTQESPYNTAEEAWQESEAKKIYDSLKGKL